MIAVMLLLAPLSQTSYNNDGFDCCSWTINDLLITAKTESKSA